MCVIEMDNITMGERINLLIICFNMKGNIIWFEKRIKKGYS